MALSTYLPTADSLTEERSPINQDIPIMMAHGTRDPLVSVENAINTRNNLTRLGYSVAWHEYPVEHTVCAPEIQDIRSWLLSLLA